MAVLGNTRSILKNASSLVALFRNDLGNLTLTDNGISVTADTRVHKQLVNILQAHGLTVDKILAFSRTIVTASDADLVVGTVKSALLVRIVKGYADLGISHRLSAVRTAEDNILHLASAQVL